MIKTILKLDISSIFYLLSSSLGFALTVLLIFNALDSVMYILILIQDPSYEKITFSFSEGHYAINDKKMGFSILYNIFGVIFLWVVMVYYKLKGINKPDGSNLFFY